MATATDFNEILTVNWKSIRWKRAEKMGKVSLAAEANWYPSVYANVFVLFADLINW